MRSENFNEFLAILSALPLERRVAFATANESKIRVASGIAESRDLGRALEVLPEENRLHFAERQQAKITNAPSLSGVIHQLSQAERMGFALKHKDKISFSSQLGVILKMLPEESQLAFVEANKALIVNTNDQANVFASLTPRNRLSFIDIEGKTLDELIPFINSLDQADRLAFIELITVKINNYYQVALLASLLAWGNQLSFLEEHRGLSSSGIASVDSLVAVLNLLPEIKKLSFAEENHLLIKDIYDLKQVLSLLAKVDRPAFCRRFTALVKDQIHRTDSYPMLELLPEEGESRLELARELATMPVFPREKFLEVLSYLKNPEHCKIFLAENKSQLTEIGDLYIPFTNLGKVQRMAFVLENKELIKNMDAFFAMLDSFDDTDCPVLVEHFKNKIKSFDELKKVLQLPGMRDLTPEQKRTFVSQFSYLIRTCYSLEEKGYERSLFNDPLVQQMMLMRSVDPNNFLFAAAGDPAREADFDFFLEHPLCSADALNAAAKTLSMHIEAQSGLSREVKDSRIAKLRAKQEIKRKERATHYLGLNLTTIKEASLLFTKSLPAIETADWSFEAAVPNDIQRFRQLIQWLKTQAFLAPYVGNFVELEENNSFRSSALFKDVLSDLEAFCATLDLYLSHIKPTASEEELIQQRKMLNSSLDILDQLGQCAAGVRSSLQSMTRALNPGASVAQAVDLALDQSVMGMVPLLGIQGKMEVHTSKDRVRQLLGAHTDIHYDPHRLPMSDYYLQAMANNAMGKIPGFLMSIFPLESTPFLREEGVIFDQTLFNTLERDWMALHSLGLLPAIAESETETSRAKWVAVLCFISGKTKAKAETFIDNYASGNMGQVLHLTLTLDKLEERYYAVLKSEGIFTLEAGLVSKLKDKIWSLLTTHEDFSTADNAMWRRLLNAPNGAALIQSVIEAHPDEKDKITLKALLHCPPACSQNLFRVFASNPCLAGWMMGWEIKSDVAGVMAFNSTSTPLAKAIGELASYPKIMHRELERIFVEPGNLLFWLGELQKDPIRASTFESIMHFIKERDMCRFDSLLSVLAEMSLKGDPLEQTMARSFLEERSKMQQELGLWSCYWTTASYAKVELNLNSKPMLLSLIDPANARAALYLAESNTNLATKLTEALGRHLISFDEYGSIMRSVRSLYAAPPPVEEAELLASPRP